jgi:hypothetical protein
MTASKIISTLSALNNNDVFFGPQGFKNVVSESELTAAQLGFGASDTGQMIADTTKTDAEPRQWQPSWQVFARDTELGDPYFVDNSQPELPVYTGFLGDNGWEIEQVASTLTAYVNCMTLLFNHGQQSQAQFFPDENTVTDEDALARLQEQLIEVSACQHFWQMFMGCYLDWLVED